MNIEHMKKALIEYAKENKEYVDKTDVQSIRNNSYQGIQKKGGYIDNGISVSVNDIL